MTNHGSALLFRVGILVLTLGLVATSCGGDADDEQVSTPTEPVETTAADTTAAPTTTTTTAAPTSTTTTTTTTTTVPTAGPWEQIAGGDECMCADGSDYSFWVREADPKRVVFYLEGGGACASLPLPVRSPTVPTL